MKISETQTLHLPILVEQDEDNVYIVSCPVFKGCHSYGSTIDEALSHIKEVINICIEEEKEKASEINRFCWFQRNAGVYKNRCGLNPHLIFLSNMAIVLIYNEKTRNNTQIQSKK